MGQTYDQIPDHVMDWIPKQHMFWVATAPQALDGHINISPKGVAGTFHLVSPTQVWYEDLSGTGAETIAHIRENGRITILFNAFEGPPRIARLYGKGSYHEFGSAEYNRLLPLGTRQPGSRAVIIVDIWKVAATCGYSVPYYTFVGHRVRLLDWAAKREKIDHEETQTQPSSLSHDHSGQVTGTLHPKGMAAWWRDRNMFSLDGLPALSTAFSSTLGVGSHKPIPKATAPGLHNRSSSSRTHSIDERQLGPRLAVARSCLVLWDSLTCLWEWITSALSMIILFSPIIGYPPLSTRPSGTQIHHDPALRPRHKMGPSAPLVDETRSSQNLSSILGYGFSFLLGVVLTLLISSTIDRPIDGLGLICLNM
ncbi:pyridoxamine phosphate oxidase [Coprinopsis sp. MPI-PUGE-AT-0042]|nr:pyridoxamine phosphate oxidase [Coprinopsis sp. MPI-PUGE-AT-0042]